MMYARLAFALLACTGRCVFGFSPLASSTTESTKKATATTAILPNVLLQHGHQSSRRQDDSALSVANLRDADFFEMMVGGERYEMVPLPDSMVDTTCFVGNLCEFVRDDDLSDLFRCVSPLKSALPACVARKPNMNSLHYGFVSFPSIEQKEVRLLDQILVLPLRACCWDG